MKNNTQRNYSEQYDMRFGVLSLTADPCLESMWEKYADFGKGFCVGYNSRIMFENFGGGWVSYVEQLPILLPEPIMTRYQIRSNQIFSKEMKHFLLEFVTVVNCSWN